MTTTLYNSKPHSIKAFQFTKEYRTMTDFPDWFQEQANTGKASFTRDKYITVYSEYHNERAYTGSWICLSSIGKLYVLPEEQFHVCYG